VAIRNGGTTATSPEEEILKEVDRCKGRLYMQIKHIIKSLMFVPDPAVANSCNSLANHSTKKHTTTHGGGEVDCNGHDGVLGLLEE
jgi:hypothetical protein